MYKVTSIDVEFKLHMGPLLILTITSYLILILCGTYIILRLFFTT